MWHTYDQYIDIFHCNLLPVWLTLHLKYTCILKAHVKIQIPQYDNTINGKKGKTYHKSDKISGWKYTRTQTLILPISSFPSIFVRSILVSILASLICSIERHFWFHLPLIQSYASTPCPLFCLKLTQKFHFHGLNFTILFLLLYSFPLNKF